MRLNDAFEATALEHPTKVAIAVVGGASITFADLDRRSTRLARALVADGIRPGDRVGIVAGHDVESIVLFFAVFKAAAIVVWLNDQSDPQGLAAVLRSAEPARVFCDNAKHLAQIQQAAPDVRASLLEEVTALESRSDEATVLPQGQDTDIAAIVYTSGSTGTPKGVCLTHRSLLTVVRSVIEHMPMSSADSYLMVVPLHYVHGLMQLLVHTIVGATIHLAVSFAFPRRIIDMLRDTAVTGFSGVPFHFNALIDKGGFLDAALPALKWLTVTGGKLPASRIEQIVKAKPDVAFHIAYGQTECSPRATALHPSKILAKIESVGSPIPNVRVLLLDEDGREVAHGEAGEVVIEGANVMAGYWRDPEGTRDVVDEHGRLHTGDIGRFDEDGDLFLVGRRSAMIKSAGERIFPEELERVLVAHPFVGEAVVVGVDDPLYGQRVVAHLAPADGRWPAEDAQVVEEVRKFCLSRVPFARAPREYVCWSTFPRKANGKPDRQVIGTTKRP